MRTTPPLSAAGPRGAHSARFTRGVLGALLLGATGCGLAREVEVCRAVAREFEERLPKEGTRAGDLDSLRRAATSYRELSARLETAHKDAPTVLAPPLQNLAREARQLGEALDRAEKARTAEQLAPYRSAERSIEASGRRFKEATRELERLCHGGR